MGVYLLDIIQVYLIVPKIVQFLLLFYNLNIFYQRYKTFGWKRRPLINKLFMLATFWWLIFISLDIIIFIIAPLSIPVGTTDLFVQGYDSEYFSVTFANILRDVAAFGAIIQMFAYLIIPFTIKYGEKKILQHIKRHKYIPILMAGYLIFGMYYESVSVQVTETTVHVDAVWTGFAGLTLLIFILLYFFSAIYFTIQLTMREHKKFSKRYQTQIRNLLLGIFFMGFGYIFLFIAGTLKGGNPDYYLQEDIRLGIQFTAHIIWTLSPFFIMRGSKLPLEEVNPTLQDIELISMERFRDFLEKSLLAIFVIHDQEIITYNARFSEIFQIDEDISNKNIDNNKKNHLPLSKFIHRIARDDREKFLANLEELKKGEHIGTISIYRINTPSGDKKWIRQFSNVLLVKDEKIIQSAILEITEEKRLANEIIKERRKTEEERYKRERLESIALLAGGIAHDYNNILTSILGNINLIQVYPNLDPELEEYVDDLEIATKQAKNLTNQLLTFTKGGNPMKKPASITKIVEDSARFILRGSNCDWNLSISGDVPNVNVDVNQISQVFHNLLINAVHAMPNGGTITLEISSTKITKANELNWNPGTYAVVKVIDTGIGIPEELQIHIFEPYFSTKERGTGLGLATSYSIIKKHRGYIQFESEKGKGTVFTVFLPVSSKKLPTENKIRRIDKHDSGTVLIMDDNIVLQKTLSKMCQKIGYKTLTANDGKSCLETYKKDLMGKKEIDMVIIDLLIPGGMGGEETIKRLVEIDPNVKAIVSSGFSNDDIMADPSSHGFKAILKKPYTLDELKKVLAEVKK